MKTYYLYKTKTGDHPGRVVLNNEMEKDAELIRTIEAKSWIDARLTIADNEFYRIELAGYFA